MKKRWLAGLLTAAMLVTLLPTAALAAEGDVEYLTCDENGANWQTETKASGTYTEVTADDTTWGADDDQPHWYVVNGEVTIYERVSAVGDVHLILTDGCHLNATKGISVQDKDDGYVSDPDCLTIYAQSMGKNMGKLTATGGGAAIGASGGTQGSGFINYNSGIITIYGGNITAEASSYSTGIGGGNGSHQTAGTGRCNVTIHGGNVTARAGQWCGIDLGTAGGTGNGSVTITGGTVTAGGIGGSFSTGENGNAVINSSDIKDETDIANWHGVIYQGDTGKIYGGEPGSLALTADAWLPKGKTLNVNVGETLTVAEGATLTNNGLVLNSGAITINGTLQNNGAILDSGTITGTVRGNQPVASADTMTVTYLDEHGALRTQECTRLTTDTTSLGQSNTPTWYVALPGPLNIGGRVEITGEVHLVLMDYAQLNANSGIHLANGNSLTIYGQSRGGNTGKLTAKGGNYQAGIGGNDAETSGALTINGGAVEARGGAYGAGIGGGGHYKTGVGDFECRYGGNCGAVTINGGIVTAYGGIYAAGIGGGGGGQITYLGRGGSGGAVTIHGGTVTAQGSNNGAGIGGGGHEWDGYTGGAGSFSTDTDGHAFITASSIGDTASQGDWSGVIFQGNDGQVYGDRIELAANGEISGSRTLKIEEGKCLTVPGGVTLTVNGKIDVQEGGNLVVEGTVTGSGTITPDKFKLSRPDPTGPAAPTVQSATASSVTLDEISDAEYSRDGANWQTDRVFNDLTSETAYTFYARYKATGLYQASNSSAGKTQYTAFAAPENPEACYTIDYINETATANNGYEIGDNNDRDWVKTVDPITPSDWYASVIYVRKAKTESIPAGDSDSSRLPNRPAAPTTVQSMDVSAVGASDGKLTGVDETMEYRKDGDSAWTACPNGEVTGLSVGNYYVRFKATEAAFYSKEATIALREPAAADQSFCLNDGSINVSQDGDKVVVTQNGAQYTIADGQVRITGNGETPNTISVNGATADITLDHVQISSSDSHYPYPVELDSSHVTLTLEGDNAILADYVGIQLYDGSDLVIDGSGTLTIGEPGHPVSAGISLSGGWGSNSSVTVNGGTLNIYAGSVGIAGYRGSSITINGGTVDLTGNEGVATITSGSVTVTGGSVTAGGINPAPTSDGSTPVYAVTVDGLGSGAVDAFLLKQGDAVQFYGAPACTDTSGNLVLYLPEGEYTGSAIVGGKLVNFTCAVALGGTAEPSEVENTGVTVTTPEGEKPSINDDGTVTVPGGGSVQTGDGPVVTLPEGGKVDSENGTVTVPEGGSVQVGSDPATTIIPPRGEAVKPKEDGTVEVPGGSTVQTGDGPELTLGDQGGTVGENGGVTVPEGGTVTVKDESGTTTITLPSGGAVKPNPDGTIPLPGGAVVEKDGEVITVPDDGGTYRPEEGTVTQDICTVTFDSQGGSAVEDAKVTYGNKVTKPTDPTRDGHSFNGWYHEKECTSAFDFDTYIIREDVTLYAGWTKDTPVEPVDPVKPGSSGGGSSVPSTYRPTVEQPGEGGTVAISPAAPRKGDTVTITPKPDEGYEVEKITVTDRNGKAVEVTKNPDGTYSFTQPSGRVKIAVSYQPSQPAETPWSNPFTDVAEGTWYYEAVEFAAEKGLFAGTSASTFSPNETMTRAMLMTVLARLDGQETEGGDTWYAKGMAWAVKQGISDGTDPNGPITREQLAAMLYRYAKAEKSSGDLNAFVDADSVSSWAQDAMTWAVENGIIHGKGGGVLDPKGQATRAEVAQMLKNFMTSEEVQA